MNDKKKTEQELARKRTEVILQVRAGKMTAKEAAKALGISRKTYYEWEERGLQGMMEALLNRPSGRPRMETDAEKARLKKKVEDLEKKLSLAQHADQIRKIQEGLPSLKDLDPDNPYLKDKKKEEL